MYSKRNVIKIAAIVFICTLIYSCSSALYEPDLKEVKDEALFAELKEGRKVYVEKCGSCHNLYLPEKFSKSRWEEELDEMQKRAKLTDKEKANILKYVTFGK